MDALGFFIILVMTSAELNSLIGWYIEDIFIWDASAYEYFLTASLANAKIAMRAIGQRISQMEASLVRLELIQFFFMRALKCYVFCPILSIYNLCIQKEKGLLIFDKNLIIYSLAIILFSHFSTCPSSPPYAICLVTNLIIY